MPEPGPVDEEGLDALLARLEAAIGRLSDQGAPLDRLVADHEEAQALLARARRRWDEAEARVRALQPALEARRGEP
jgi:exodeoxyribonuclease VII small subunit